MIKSAEGQVFCKLGGTKESAKKCSEIDIKYVYLTLFYFKSNLQRLHQKLGGGGVQLHFCTWPPDFCQMYMYKNVQNMFFTVWPLDFCQMYMYKNVQKCTKYVFSCLATRFLPNVHVQKCTKYVFSVFPVPFPGISDFLYIFYDHQCTWPSDFCQMYAKLVYKNVVGPPPPPPKL